MAKKTHIKVRLVPETKPDSAFFYYVKKPSGGEKAKIKLKARKYNPATKKHEIFEISYITKQNLQDRFSGFISSSISKIIISLESFFEKNKYR